MLKNFQKTELYKWVNPNTYTGTRRLVHQVVLLAMTGLLIFSAISPLFELYITHKYYSLNSQTAGLVGSVTDTLAKQITYDNTKNAYVFNAAGMTPTTQTVGPDKVPLSLLQAKVSGNKSAKTLYSVVMPTDSKQGISYYDSNTGLSFQLVPQFTQMSAQQVTNHVVYPINQDMQMVYSVKNNGLKEDIVLKQFAGDSFNYSYSLKLPGTLEARLLTDGSGDLGIYSADPSLFTHSTYGADYDPAKIESAQLHAKKDHLVFAIPAPVIKQTGQSGQGSATSEFGLSNDGSTLTISADHLKNLHYPVSIDPTVVITSTSDFSLGNNEDNNITYPANQINRGSVTGGSISGGWTATTVLPSATNTATSVAYNGYIYEIGGDNPSLTATVLYAPINSNGTIGSWTATTSLPSGWDSATSVAYNGYLYEIGGCNPSCATTAVYYAPINANGTIGAWTATTSLPSGIRFSTSVAYNGYLYEIGGYIGGATAIVDYAPINANGTIGSWTATTSLLAATYGASSAVYNGYVYILGGYTGGALTTVNYAPINANGTIGSWAATTALPAATDNASTVVYNGYIYELGGWDANTTYYNTVRYAPINANGTIGSWTVSATLPATTDWATSIAYNGYIYEIGGYNGASLINTVSYAKIDPAGYTTAYAATTNLPVANMYSNALAYNGYLYQLNGHTGAIISNAVNYATINSNGTIGSWTSTTVVPTALYGAYSVAYAGYMYVIGGFDNTTKYTTVYYAPINSNGSIGTWNTTTVLPNGLYMATAVAYNGYMYSIGGNRSAGDTAVVNYAPINSNGTLGSWAATSSLPAATSTASSVTYQGYIYNIGGTGYSAAVSYALINSNGTLGAWATTTSLPTGTQNESTVAWNGYIYSIGGYDPNVGGGNGGLKTVNYVAINSNGTLGSWSASSNLPADVRLAAAAVYNGYIYSVGGYSDGSSPQNIVNYASINNGGAGTVGAWTATTVLPNATFQATSIMYNGYLYEIGGTTSGGATNAVYYAPINTNGSIGSWTATTSLPGNTQYATSVAYNGYLYEIGGYINGTIASTVYYAPINTNGTLGSWTATTALPAPTANATSVAYNGYVYELGGYNTTLGAICNIVNYAPINSNGTIGAWTATTTLTSVTDVASSVVYNGYLYEIGGYNGTAYMTTVNYALINANGTLGAWTATTSLPIATAYSTSVAYNGYLYEIGGANPSVNSTVVYASFNANGTLGAWTATTSLPATTGYTNAAVYNGYLYEIGGHNGTSQVNIVDYAPLNVMPRTGHYSQMFNFGSAGITPFSITYSGSLPNANGLSSIQYKTAGSNAVLGSTQYSTVLNGTATDCTAVGTVQYVSVNITLDDSGSAAFPDVNTTPANVTDFTVTYNTIHPSPNLRLRGGKYFSSNVLQPLDTCAFVPVPNSPTIGTATDSGSGRAYNNGLASVTFTPSPTGYAATSYTVTASSGGYSGTGTTSPITVNNLQSGVAYTFTVTASNAIGASNPSLASNSITATTIPQTPTIGAATATGRTTATVAYTANGTGGLSNTYTATSSPGGFTGTGASPITVSGLTSGSSYTFTVTATNTNGTSSASAASGSITTFVSPSSVTYLVVAGGGGGGVGGGGAGGYLTGSLGVAWSTPLTVTVGGGGANGGTTPNNGTSGSNSVFSSVTATGGGGGRGNVVQGDGLPGGSGGGGQFITANSFGGAGTGGQGNTGGTSTCNSRGGGGGGAGAVGGNTVCGTLGGPGGNGSTFSVTGSIYAGGGGGGAGLSGQQGNGGTGGGGAGGTSTFSGTNGTVNTGGGGGGVYPLGGPYVPGNGGSGVVIVAYPSSFAAAVSTTGSPSFVDNGTNKIYTFTGSGSITF